MTTGMRVKAYAKVNLGLKVLPKRADGFHNIESIFQTLNIFDELAVNIIEGYGECMVTCDGFDLPSRNTITVAYEAFQELIGRPIPSVGVDLIKNIPSGGGLGGGSSDAASFIRVLECLCNVTLTMTQKHEIASKVGSDVFFFMHCDSDGKGAALVSGRGEIVKDIPRRSDLYFLLAFPKVHSSTKEAYSLVDQWYEKGDDLKYPAWEELEGIYNSPVKTWNFKNTFTAPLIEKYHEIGTALECIHETGALYSDMSGSGSTVFGVYSSELDVKSAVLLLNSRGFGCAVAF